MTELSQLYRDRLPRFRNAKERLRSLLNSVVKAIEDDRLVRAEVRNIRIKTLKSIKQKARTSGRDAKQVLSDCSDLVGGRVVCNNIQDVHRFAHLLKEKIVSWNGIQEQDYTNEPSKEGYRALHLNFQLMVFKTSSVGKGSAGTGITPCEVQIRSRLQDAWAELSHDDIYKQRNIPEDLRARTKDLAEVLAAAEKIANDIRSRATYETTPPEKRPDMSRVSPENLILGFGEVFGRAPSGRTVRSALTLCDRYQIASLEGLSDVLTQQELREKIGRIYRSESDTENLGPEDIFLAAFYKFVGKEQNGINWIRRKARRDLKKFEDMQRKIWREEMEG